MTSRSLSGFCLLFICRCVFAHSWIDVIAQVDDLSNVGYIRDYAGHSDAASTFTIFSTVSTQALCKSNQQSMSYTSHYPMLQIQAGKSLVANYSENGHVTKDSLAPDFKPHPGNYTWFLAANSASSPSPLSTIGQAHTIGTVIGSGNFDDGVCAEDATKGRNGPRQCQSVVQVPSNLAAGSYELIWLWNFPKVAGVVEMYSSCMDIQVSANAGAGPSDTSLAGAIDTKVALADTDGTSTSTTSAQHTTKTSTIFQTTQIFTTVPSLDTTSSPSTTSTTSPGTSSTQPSTRTTTSSPSTFTTTTLSPYTTVQQVIQEAPANPLFDSNNVDYVTELVTMTIYKKAQPTA